MNTVPELTARVRAAELDGAFKECDRFGVSARALRLVGLRERVQPRVGFDHWRGQRGSTSCGADLIPRRLRAIDAIRRVSPRRGGQAALSVGVTDIDERVSKRLKFKERTRHENLCFGH